MNSSGEWVSWRWVMVFGVFSGRHSFPVIPITFFLAWLGMEMDRLSAQEAEANQEPPQAAEAEKPQAEKPEAGELSGFDLLEAYSQKVARLEAFQRERLLRDTDLQGRKSRAADEVNRVIGGLKLLMDREAQRLFDEAMSAEDPKVRDGILQKLSDSRFQLQDIRRRAEYELSRRTVGGTVYPTIEEARKKTQELEAERKKSFDGVDQKDLEDLDQLKQELLNDRLAEAAKAFAEDDAHSMLEKAERLVHSQRRALLEEIVRKHPATNGAQTAKELLAHLKTQDELLADHKLSQALASSVIYDKRWRRLKEIELYHPGTNAAWEAKRIFDEHLAQVPPMVIANHTDRKVELMVDWPYSRLKSIALKVGETDITTSAFPLVVRVNIGDNEWALYNVLPGMQYILEMTDGVPVLYCAP